MNATSFGYLFEYTRTWQMNPSHSATAKNCENLHKKYSNSFVWFLCTIRTSIAHCDTSWSSYNWENSQVFVLSYFALNGNFSFSHLGTVFLWKVKNLKGLSKYFLCKLNNGWKVPRCGSCRDWVFFSLACLLKQRSRDA